MVGDTPLGLGAELRGKATSYNGSCTDWPTSAAILLQSVQLSCKQSNPSDKLHLQDRLTEQLQQEKKPSQQKKWFQFKMMCAKHCLSSLLLTSHARLNLRE